MDVNKLPINITHFINPHLFYFKFELGKTDESEEFGNLLEKYALENAKYYPTGYEPDIGEIVVVYFQSWRKWIRGKVDYIAEFLSKPSKYILWSFEHGIPFSSTSRWILPLCETLAEQPDDSIYLGGLVDYLPALREFNYEKMRMEKVVKNEWSETTIKNVEMYLDTAAEIHFVPKAEYRGHRFGQVLVTTNTGDTINIADEIIKTGQAIFSENFLIDLRDVNTINKERWQNNDGALNFAKLSLNSTPKFINRVASKRAPKIPEVDSKVADWKMRNKAECEKFVEENTKRLQDVTSSVHRESIVPTECFMKIAGVGFKRRDAEFAEFNLRKPLQYMSQSGRSAQAESLHPHMSFVSSVIDKKADDFQSDIYVEEKDERAESIGAVERTSSNKIPPHLRRIMKLYEMNESKKNRDKSGENFNLLPSGFMM